MLVRRLEDVGRRVGDTTTTALVLLAAEGARFFLLTTAPAVVAARCLFLVNAAPAVLAAPCRWASAAVVSGDGGVFAVIGVSEQRASSRALIVDVCNKSLVSSTLA